jgi:hypothetical protein
MTALFHLSGHAQNWDRYEPIQFTGEIPSEFLGTTAEKYMSQRDSLATTGTKRERKSKDDFLLQSSYSIGDFMLSGKVLFNDPITEYLNQIKDYLLRDDPELSGKIKIYAVKSPVVNAFATNDGNVFFTLGLLSRVENEAQIAFVLCHEFQHFIHQHPIKGYVVKQQNMRDLNSLDRSEMENALVRTSIFSRDQEMQADNLGRELFLKSNYSLDSIMGLFDIMQFDYMPYENAIFDPNYLVSGPVVIPPHCLTTELTPISTEYVFDSIRSTHPSIPQRRAVVKKALEENKREGVAMLLGEGRFHTFVKMARYEVAEMYLESLRYEEALYQCYLLQREDPSSFYLRKTAAWALYGIAKYKNEKQFYQIKMETSETEGEMGQLVHILTELEAHEVTLLAVRKLWEVHLLDRDDREVNLALEDLLADWWRLHKGKAEKLATAAPSDEFFARARANMNLAAKGEKPVVDSSQAMLDRDMDAPLARALQEGKRNNDRAVPEDPKFKVEEEPEEKEIETFAVSEEDDSVNYFRYALTDLIAKEEFKTLYDHDKDSEWKEMEWTYEDQKAWQKELRKGKNLGLSKVVFVDPTYIHMDKRKRVSMDYVGAEKKESELHSQLKTASSDNNLKHDILSEQTIKEKGIDAFNDLVVLREWLHERFSHDEVDMVNLHADEALALKEKYGTSNFTWIGGITTAQRRSTSNTILLCCCTATFPYALPYTIYYIATPEREGVYYTYTVDVETDKRLGAMWKTFSVKDGSGFWDRNFHKTAKQLKTK